MSVDDELTPAPAQPSGPRVPKLSREESDALTWLGKWLGIPFLVVLAIYYSEFLWRGSNVNVVPTVTRQEVKPYPFPDGATVPTLAPPDIPRAPRQPSPPPSLVFEAPPAPPTPSQIVARPIEQPKPIYPRRALEAEREGVVRLRITIQPDGSVSDAVVSSAQPPGWFEDAAIAAVKKWRFHSGDHIIVTPVEIEFKLN